MKKIFSFLVISLLLLQNISFAEFSIKTTLSAQKQESYKDQVDNVYKKFENKVSKLPQEKQITSLETIQGKINMLLKKKLSQNNTFVLNYLNYLLIEKLNVLKGNTGGTTSIETIKDNTQNNQETKQEVKQPVVTGEYTDESWDAVTKLNTFDEVVKYLNYYPSNNDKKLIAYTKLTADRNYGGYSQKNQTLNAYWREGINPGVPKFLYPVEDSKTVYDVTDKVIPQVQKDIVGGIKYTGSGFYPNEIKLEKLQNLYKTDKGLLNQYLKDKYKWYLENGSATSDFIEKTWIKDTTYLKFYVQSEILGQSLKDHNINELGYTLYPDIESHSFYNEDKDLYRQAYQEEIQRRFGLTSNEFNKKVLEEYLQKGQELGLLNSNWKVTQLPKNLQHFGTEYDITHPYTESDKVKPIGFEVSGARSGVGVLGFSGNFVNSINSASVGDWNWDTLVLFSDYLK